VHPFVLDAVHSQPDADPAEIAGLLRRKKKFVDQFRVTRRTIEMDVAAIMKFGKPE
jgi:hypothetical protein